MLGFTRCASTACFTQASQFIAGVPLCEEHEEEIRQHFAPATEAVFVPRPATKQPTKRIGVGPKIDMAEIFRLQKEQRASRVYITSRERLTPEQGATDPATAETRGCVYYITWRRDDRFVKIGTTLTASRRFKELNGPTGDRVRLLVAEPGSYEQESARHEQFANLRKPGTELFAYTQQVVDHIAELRDRFPHYRDFTDVGRSYD
ncbi:GIY-YIG nuclease family protein [Streptomyces sp. NPDC056227]|uniref:GIY-YIG nuclease family protein n=1 Tax=Streptomyces sp. NPDC056227 TaxID=3345753 RepID=UPI0035D5E36B